ncbi:MAG: prepilin-type N-terminal cleavage/methylation domain-containing protein [Planctomycetota bacterium]
MTRKGGTLIEVVAAIALLGSVLAAAVRGAGSQLRSMAESRERLAAVEAADRLLSDWSASGGYPDATEGEIVGTPLRYRLEESEWTSDDEHALSGRIVTLRVDRDGSDNVLVEVDLLVPAENASSNASHPDNGEPPHSTGYVR